MKRQAQGVVSNFRRGPHPGAVLVIAPALVAVLALGGVTTSPALSISSEREAVAVAESRSTEFDAELALSRRYRELDLARRGRLGIELARSRMPTSVDPLVAQGVIRLAAARAGLDVESLAIGELVVPELPARFDRVAAQTFDLGVAGPLGALARLERHVAALGFPCCVLELQIDLPDPNRPRATARVRLGLLHLAAGLPTADEPSPDENHESP